MTLAISKIIKGTAAVLAAANPVALLGDQFLETDTGKVKIGDGSTAYNSLAYTAASSQNGARIKRTTAQTIGNNAVTAISFDTADLDTSSWYSGGSPTRLTVPASANGKLILVVASVDWTANATGIRFIQIAENGTDQVSLASLTTTVHASQTVSAVLVGVTGHYFTLTVYQSSGGNLDVITTNTVPQLSAVVI